MDEVSVNVVVFFEKPFWVGVVECAEAGHLRVCKVTFGAEPKDYHIYEFLLRNFYELHFGPAVETVVKELHTNPKRKQREIRKHLDDAEIGTKSQQALSLQRKQMKMERRVKSREQKEWGKQQKKKEKHKGR